MKTTPTHQHTNHRTTRKPNRQRTHAPGAAAPGKHTYMGTHRRTANTPTRQGRGPIRNTTPTPNTSTTKPPTHQTTTTPNRRGHLPQAQHTYMDAHHHNTNAPTHRGRPPAGNNNITPTHQSPNHQTPNHQHTNPPNSKPPGAAAPRHTHILGHTPTPTRQASKPPGAGSHQENPPPRSACGVCGHTN